MMKHEFIYILFWGLLLVGCSKEIEMNTPGEVVTIDFACDGITRSDGGTSTEYMFTLMPVINSGKPVSDVYSNTGETLSPTNKILAANNATYQLVIASPAKAMLAIDPANPETSAYGYKVERNGANQPYINTTPISVVVDGIKANNAYIYDLKNVTLKEQRSKVKVQFKVLDKDYPRTITKLYYKNVRNEAYTCPNSGLLYGDNEANNDVYEFTDFPTDGKDDKTYNNTVSVVEPVINDDGTSYFISDDYTDLTLKKTPYLCIGLVQDGKEKLIEMPLDIVMEPMMTYTYDIKISSTELTIHVSASNKWDSVEVEGSVDASLGSFTINIATGVVSDWALGSNAHGGIEPPTSITPDPEQLVDYTTDNSSNCYILNPAQDKTMVYYIPIKRIDEFWGDTDYVTNGMDNTLTNVGENWEAVIFWHDFSNPHSTAAISTLTVEKSVAPDNTTPAVKVTLPKEFYDTDNHCNVGFLVRRTDQDDPDTPQFEGDVLWSWHLWITDYDPDGLVNKYQSQIQADNTAQAYGGVSNGRKNEIHCYEGTLWNAGDIYEDRIIMDRNIGARSPDFEGHGSIKNNTTSAPGTLCYQFGRKDPFPRAALYTNGYTYGTASPQQDFAYAVNHPNTFVTVTDDDGNWCSDADAEATTYIWNDSKISVNNYKNTGKSIFDPSPLGFRLPITGTWSDFTGSNSQDEESNHNNYTFLWTQNLDPLPLEYDYGRRYRKFAYYPASGFRDRESGALNSGGSSGYCWSATPQSAADGYCFVFDGTVVHPENSQSRAHGFPVRPIQE